MKQRTTLDNIRIRESFIIIRILHGQASGRVSPARERAQHLWARKRLAEADIDTGEYYQYQVVTHGATSSVYLRLPQSTGSLMRHQCKPHATCKPKKRCQKNITCRREEDPPALLWFLAIACLAWIFVCSGCLGALFG